MMRSQYVQKRHPDRVRCVPDIRLRRLFDERPAQVRKVALVRYDAEFARWQLWCLQHTGSFFDQMRRVVDPVAVARRRRL